MPVVGGHDLVVRLGARHPGEVEAVADLDALDRLDAHQRGGEPGVQPAVPVHVRAEAHRHAVGQHLDDPAEGVAVLVGLVDLGDHRLLASASRQRTGSASSFSTSAGVGYDAVRRLGRGQLDDVRDDLDAGRLLQVGAGHGAEGDPGGGLPGARRAPGSGGPRRSRTSACPARSAWPGRGRVSGALRASPARISGSTGSAAMTCSHFGHSVLPTMIATGEPRVRPCRTPPRKVTSSRSNFIRAPRP